MSAGKDAIKSMKDVDRQRVTKRLDRLAWYMDSSIPLPGSGARVGIDALIGLIPGIGDTLGAIVSSYILSEAVRLGAPKTILVKMAFNIFLDAAVGVLPVLGDLFDFVWKANQRNVNLLEEYMVQPRKAVASSRLFAWGLVGALMALVILVSLLGYLLVRALWSFITSL